MLVPWITHVPWAGQCAKRPVTGEFAESRLLLPHRPPPAVCEHGACCKAAGCKGEGKVTREGTDSRKGALSIDPAGAQRVVARSRRRRFLFSANAAPQGLTRARPAATRCCSVRYTRHAAAVQPAGHNACMWGCCVDTQGTSALPGNPLQDCGWSHTPWPQSDVGLRLADVLHVTHWPAAAPAAWPPLWRLPPTSATRRQLPPAAVPVTGPARWAAAAPACVRCSNSPNAAANHLNATRPAAERQPAMPWDSASQEWSATQVSATPRCLPLLKRRAAAACAPPADARQLNAAPLLLCRRCHCMGVAWCSQPTAGPPAECNLLPGRSCGCLLAAGHCCRLRLRRLCCCMRAARRCRSRSAPRRLPLLK